MWYVGSINGFESRNIRISSVRACGERGAILPQSKAKYQMHDDLQMLELFEIKMHEMQRGLFWHLVFCFNKAIF